MRLTLFPFLFLHFALHLLGFFQTLLPLALGSRLVFSGLHLGNDFVGIHHPLADHPGLDEGDDVLHL